MAHPVTIVLPVHNAERTLRPMVSRILELANAPGRRLTIAVVDDGSTDDTFETASELARDYPQVRAFRLRFQSGLGAAVEEVRRRMNIDEAIVHDGVGPLDMAELSALLNEGPAHSAGRDSLDEHRGSRRFAAVTALHARLTAAHRSVASLHWLRLTEPARPRRRAVPLMDLNASPAISNFPIPLG